MEDPRRRYPDAPPDFRPLGRPDRANVFSYFSKALIKTIHEFADTERGKYPPKFQAMRTGDVFSSEVIQKCNRYRDFTRACLNDTNQKLEHWISRVMHPDETLLHGIIQAPCYVGVDRDLATVLKILIAENEMQPVLGLAYHPSVPLETLYEPTVDGTSWPNTLFKYYCQGRYYLNLRGFQGVMDKALRDYNPGSLFHYSDLGALDEEGVWKPLVFGSQNYETIDIFGDMKRLKKYLKACFAVLYRTEMMARECGKVIPWLELVEIALSRFHVTL
ncbi:hypothetical protein BGZ67_006527 [Mortierella alpina]|nr:hypothetical protein BGZ67_006527 [Mortierella alpina]